VRRIFNIACEAAMVAPFAQKRDAARLTQTFYMPRHIVEKAPLLLR
jgi:hypothetical protein